MHSLGFQWSMTVDKHAHSGIIVLCKFVNTMYRCLPLSREVDIMKMSPSHS